jgi:cold shock protein
MSNKQTGHVEFWNKMKGFGFVVPDDDGTDVFLHVTQVTDGRLFEASNEKIRVRYDIGEARDNRKMAVNVEVIGDE